MEDGCIYYLPSSIIDRRSCVLKLDPDHGDSLSLVGEKTFGEANAVLGKDGSFYCTNEFHVYKCNPIDHTFTCLGRPFTDRHNEFEGLVLADDGNIYSANQAGQILIIDTVHKNWTIFGRALYKNYHGRGWGYPVLGADKCIYFPPARHDRVLKYNPSTYSISLIGESYGKKLMKWRSGVLASDGFIYCAPHNANEILQIDSRHTNEQVVEMIKNLQKVPIEVNEEDVKVKKMRRI